VVLAKWLQRRVQLRRVSQVSRRQPAEICALEQRNLIGSCRIIGIRLLKEDFMCDLK
jgi:hypothetical protein